MGEVVDLRRPIPLEDDEFIENLARFADGTLTEAAVKAKYHLSEEEWTALGSNDALVEKIEDVKIHRIRSGRTKRERAQNEIIDAPPILSKIMRDPGSNARHVIDAVKSLDSLATGGSSEAAAAGTRFEIRIDLGGDHVLHFSKPIEINAGDTDTFNDDDTNITTPWGMFAAITAKKEDSGGGNNTLTGCGRNNRSRKKNDRSKYQEDLCYSRSFRQLIPKLRSSSKRSIGLSIDGHSPPSGYETF